MSGGREVRRGWSMGSLGAVDEGEKRRRETEADFFYSSKDEIKGFSLREQREQKRSGGELPGNYKMYFSLTLKVDNNTEQKSFSR